MTNADPVNGRQFLKCTSAVNSLADATFFSVVSSVFVACFQCCVIIISSAPVR